MDITLYRYRLEGATWGEEVINEKFLNSIIKEMMALPFQGDEAERKYGFVHCGHQDGSIYGLFVQKFPKVSTDYDATTKEEQKQEVIDSGAYLLILRPAEYELYLQSKRSSDLPEKAEIEKRLTSILRLAFNKTSYMFTKFVETQDEIDRDHIVRIFYEEADEILEMEFADFDVSLIEEEKQKRAGKIQTYFNPIEEYQEAMQEAAVRIGTNAEKASIKSKKGASLKKDPITRAMLESSRKPTKIVYTKEEKEITDSAVTKKKEVISIEGGNFDLENPEQISDILQKLFSRGEAKSIKPQNKKNEGQAGLFDNN